MTKKTTAGTKSRTARQDVKPARNELLARENKVLELRAAGWSLDRIAAETGYCDSSGACKALRRALLRQASLNVDELRAMESHKLDQLEANLQELLRLPGVAIDSAVRVLAEIRKTMERRSRLHGLDAGMGGGQDDGTAGRGNDWTAERGYDLVIKGDGLPHAVVPWDKLKLNPAPGRDALPPPSVVIPPSLVPAGAVTHILATGGFELGGVRYSLPEEDVSAELLAALAGDDDAA